MSTAIFYIRELTKLYEHHNLYFHGILGPNADLTVSKFFEKELIKVFGGQ